MSSLHNDYLEQQHENLLDEEHQYAQEEAHKHFVAVEFSDLVLNSGPTYMLNKLTKDAKEELLMALQGAK